MAQETRFRRDSTQMGYKVTLVNAEGNNTRKLEVLDVIMIWEFAPIMFLPIIGK
jgi:hypothetical protein